MERHKKRFKTLIYLILKRSNNFSNAVDRVPETRPQRLVAGIENLRSRILHRVLKKETIKVERIVEIEASRNMKVVEDHGKNSWCIKKNKSKSSENFFFNRSPKSISGKTRERRDSSSSDSSGSDNKLVLNKDLLEKLENERQRALGERKKWKEQVSNTFIVHLYELN